MNTLLPKYNVKPLVRSAYVAGMAHKERQKALQAIVKATVHVNRCERLAAANRL
jgi:hypothetical protein